MIKHENFLFIIVVVDDKFVPTINRCNATFTYHDYEKNMDIYSYFGDATDLTEPFVLWTNQQDFNILEMTMEAIYDTKFNMLYIIIYFSVTICIWFMRIKFVHSFRKHEPTKNWR